MDVQDEADLADGAVTPRDSEGRPDTGGDRPAVRAGAVLVLLAAGGLVLSLLSAGALWWTGDSSWARVAPGPVVDVRGSLAGTATDPTFAQTDDGWLVTTITAQLLGNPEAVRARLVADDDLARVDVAAQADARVSAQLSMEHTRRLAPALAAVVAGRTHRLPPHDQLHVVLVDGDAPMSPGDVVVELDGAPATWQRWHASTGAHVDLTVAPGGDTTRSRTVRLTAAQTDDVRVMPRLDPALGDVFDLSDVTGGSGGLIMTLAALDASSPGTLSVGPVAGTGAVTPDGAVLPVEGALVKARAAAAAGATVFLHAADGPQLPDQVARPDGTSMPLVAVTDVSAAVEWLCDAGAGDEVCADR